MLRPIAATFAVASFVSIASIASMIGCAAQASDPTTIGADENATPDRGTESITGDLPVGSIVRATTGVNLRTGPSTGRTILDVLSTGDTATIVAASPQSGFYQIHWHDLTGWSSGKYLSLVSKPAPPPPADDAGVPADSGGSSSSGGGVGAGAAPWSCGGTWGTHPSDDGSYFMTAYGCWIDAAGNAHGDSGDNCIPGCFAQAKSAGLCDSGASGKSCEESVTWYVADAGRFGCLQRLRVKNPKNGKSVIAVALDYGPACWVERNVSHGVLDASGRVNRYLFGSDQGYADRANVVIEMVPNDTPLGAE